MKPKAELIRVVRTPDGEIVLDTKGKVSGRGAYLCSSTECLKRVMKSKALERAFSVQIPTSVYETLQQKLEEQQ